MSILDKIVEKKKDMLSNAKTRTTLTELKEICRDMEKPRDFTSAVERISGSIKFIAEIKKASPSHGIIRDDFNHIEIATLYEEKKVDALSVITEEDFFQGNLSFIADVRNVSTRPLLRKDFIIDDYQIYEARANRADAILLIATILESTQADEYIHLAYELGMAVLFEIHEPAELDMAFRLKAPIIGINNRNLKTLRVDIDTTLKLRNEVPAGRIIVSESGINARSDVVSLERAGIDAVLVGTSLMKAQDIAQKIDELRGGE